MSETVYIPDGFYGNGKPRPYVEVRIIQHLSNIWTIVEHVSDGRQTTVYRPSIQPRP